MRGDMLRDTVNAIMRVYHRGDGPYFDKDLTAWIKQAWRLHADRPVKQVADLIIWAKLYYYFGAYKAAMDKCNEAQILSGELGYPNEQFDRNLRFVTMRVFLRLGKIAQAKHEARIILHDTDEQAAGRKKAARWVLIAPRLAMWWLDRQEEKQRSS